MKRTVIIALIALALAGTAEASWRTDWMTNGWRVREALCAIGLGWNCKFVPPCNKRCRDG